VRISAGVKENHDGASSLSGHSDGEELEERMQRNKKEWGLKREIYPRSLIYSMGPRSWARW
jgi:hypothetical protein